MSIHHLLSCFGVVAVVPTRTLGCCFFFCLWPDCNQTRACLWNLLFLWICGNFHIVLKRIDHIFDRSVGNSDPRLGIVLIHRPNSNFNFIFEVLKTGRDFQYKSNPHISLNPSFRLKIWIISKQNIFATNHWLKMCQISNVFGYEILSNFNNTHKSCFLTEFTHSVFWWKRFNLVDALLPNNLVILGIFIVDKWGVASCVASIESFFRVLCSVTMFQMRSKESERRRRSLSMYFFDVNSCLYLQNVVHAALIQRTDEAEGKEEQVLLRKIPKATTTCGATLHWCWNHLLQRCSRGDFIQNKTFSRKFWPKNEICLNSHTNIEFQFHICRSENLLWLPLQIQFSYFLESIL